MTREKISNPLTIVGIFSGIAEIAATTVLAFLPLELQAIFVWFVMGFPILLVVLFFLTWNFNPSVLYSPSDYRNDETFLTMLTRKYKSDVENNMGELETMLIDVKQELVEKTLEVFDNKMRYNSSDIEALIENKMNILIDKLDETEYTTSKFAELAETHTDISANSIPRTFRSCADLCKFLRGVIDSYGKRTIYRDTGSVLNRELARDYICSTLKHSENLNKIMNTSGTLRKTFTGMLGPKRLKILLQLIECDPNFGSICSIIKEEIR